MRDRETIDAELRRIALARQATPEQGGKPSYRQFDELLDERLGHLAGPSETEALEALDAELAAHLKTRDVRPRRRKRGLLRLGSPMVLPLALLVVAATALVVVFAIHKRPPTAEPTAAEPSAEPAAAAPARPVVPPAPAPTTNVADTALVAALKHEGLPVPSQEYVAAHGHAVCDFLARQPNFTQAADFVQQSTVWDAAQSADFTAGAIVSYCPQYQATTSEQMQQTYQNTLSNLQAIEGNLQGIKDHLRGIEDNLPQIPGHQ
jgi:Protein of unknown function (DUF732)